MIDDFAEKIRLNMIKIFIFLFLSACLTDELFVWRVFLYVSLSQKLGIG